jgi:GDP-4-dehydro-6-deoxy-D-mannose reductase
MRVLITGAAGFVGRHVAELLRGAGHEVWGTMRRSERREIEVGADRVLLADVEQSEAVDRAVAAARPQALVHLAGLSFVPDSHADPTAALRTNALGLVHVLAAVRRHSSSCRVLAVGSADAYGLIGANDLPVRESCPLRPLSPYGASKAAADLIAHQWARGYGLDVIRVRPFNHVGPGQRAVFALPNFARQIAAIERGERPARLEVGNLDVVRDFTDVRDVAAAYAALLENGARGEAYNVASGVGRSMRDAVQALTDLARVKVEISVAAERVRSVDVPVVIGSAEKLRQVTGWRPRYEWSQTLADILADQRARSG